MRIKNWKRFQHFKERNSPWIKLYRDLLDDPDFDELDGNAVRTLIKIWLCADKEGELPDYRKLSYRLRIPEKELRRQIPELHHWLEDDDIKLISDRYQVDTREGEGEREEIPRKRGRYKIPLPENWAPPQDTQPDDLLELPRFRDHAKSTDRKCADWNAAWRNWLRSPFRKKPIKPFSRDGII